MNISIPRNIEAWMQQYSTNAWEQLQAGAPDGAVICLSAIVDNQWNDRKIRAQAATARAAVRRFCAELIEARIKAGLVSREAVGAYSGTSFA